MRVNSYNLSSVCFSKAGQILFSGSSDGSIQLWRVTSGQLIRNLKRHWAGVKSICFSEKENLLASGSWDRSIKLWNWKTGKEIKTLKEGSICGVYVGFQNNRMNS